MAVQEQRSVIVIGTEGRRVEQERLFRRTEEMMQIHDFSGNCERTKK